MHARMPALAACAATLLAFLCAALSFRRLGRKNENGRDRKGEQDHSGMSFEAVHLILLFKQPTQQMAVRRSFTMNLNVELALS